MSTDNKKPEIILQQTPIDPTLAHEAEQKMFRAARVRELIAAIREDEGLRCELLVALGLQDTGNLRYVVGKTLDGYYIRDTWNGDLMWGGDTETEAQAAADNLNARDTGVQE